MRDWTVLHVSDVDRMALEAPDSDLNTQQRSDDQNFIIRYDPMASIQSDWEKDFRMTFDVIWQPKFAWSTPSNGQILIRWDLGY